MEFFNYDYCIKLNKQNELDKLNINICEIKKEIETKKTNIKTILESYINYNCLIKFRLLNLKHIIIKFIISIYNTKKISNTNTTAIIDINNEVNKFNSVKYNLLLHKLNKTSDQNVYVNNLNHIICKLSNKYSVNNDMNNTIEINTNLLFIYINNRYVANIINNIVINLSKLVYKKNKKLYGILHNYLQDNKLNINEILFKILNLYKLFNLNSDITEFFKIKKENSAIIKLLNKDKTSLLKKNKNNDDKTLKSHNNVNNKIKLYNKIYLCIYKKHNNMCITISKYEKNIVKLSNLLKVFNDKYIRLNKEMLDITLISCPNELKQKCIEFDNDNHTCCICLDPIKTGIKTSCNHIFHIYCINLYIYSILHNEMGNINLLCPLCRNYI